MNLSNTTLKQRYFLRKLVGHGGMADVYQAWDQLRAADVAVKILRRDLAQNEHFTQAFRREAESLRKLEHPNIVRLFEFQDREDPVFLVMAWVDGGNLRQRIDALRRPFTPAEVALILHPISTALNYAHRLNTYHCDIKPSNIMLHHNASDVLLADFGVARLASEAGVGGTPPYMAPEQFAGHVSAQSDIYSLGVTIYEMLSGGNLPYHGDSYKRGSTTRARYEWEHNHLDLPPLSQFNANLPADLIKVVNCALKKNPNDRYASALEFYRDFVSAPLVQAKPAPPERVTVIKKLERSEPPEARQERTLKPEEPDGQLQSPDTALRGVPHIYVRAGELAGRSFAIPKQGLKIGRNPDCQVRLRERSTSREHATVFVTKTGPYIRDEGSSLGTFVNGKLIPAHAPVALHDGDVIQAGHSQYLEFHMK